MERWAWGGGEFAGALSTAARGPCCGREWCKCEGAAQQGPRFGGAPPAAGARGPAWLGYKSGRPGYPRSFDVLWGRRDALRCVKGAGVRQAAAGPRRRSALGLGGGVRRLGPRAISRFLGLGCGVFPQHYRGPSRTGCPGAAPRAPWGGACLPVL
ncbi:MAG: hypothetical protein J3K34DRAFT_208916 [Monoraphidium minutum]|nr:MAG: hypothetical protein J3K34DRAFT_208916 [Monoraphidium minutum]